MSEISGICLFLVSHLNNELTRALTNCVCGLRARAQKTLNVEKFVNGKL